MKHGGVELVLVLKEMERTAFARRVWGGPKLVLIIYWYQVGCVC